MELLGAKQVSEMIGVPVGTLRYWRHSDIGPDIGGIPQTTPGKDDARGAHY